MTIGLLIGTDDLHQFFFENCPESLISPDINFVSARDLHLADLYITTTAFINELPKDRQVPILLLSDDKNNIAMDERILSVLPLPTDPDTFTILAEVTLHVKFNLDTYKSSLVNEDIQI